jgi:hypothetical protein
VDKYVQFTLKDPVCPEQYKIRTPVQYRGTIKLHGTNAGVACSVAGLVAQSRTRALALDDDHEGFAKFVSTEAQTQAIREIEKSIREEHNISDDTTIYLYGEWCGPGIMKGTAINSLPDKQWVLFAVRAGETYIDALFPLKDKYADARIFSVLDVPSWTLEVDFSSRDSKQTALEKATEYTDAVEAQCPWGTKFGVTGIGEGIVWTPLGQHWGKTDLFFKTKGEKHKKVKSKKDQPDIDPEVLDSIGEFVEFAVTEARLEQGLDVLKENGHAVEMRSMGIFLKWLSQDVARECAVELEASRLEWKQVQGQVTTQARDYFKGICTKF